MPFVFCRYSLHVSIHVPLAEHDRFGCHRYLYNRCFNSRAPRGARRAKRAKFTDITGFNSRAPRGARPPRQGIITPRNSFNSRAPRGARPLTVENCNLEDLVSIHVPLAEHDICTGLYRFGCFGFNSRAPRGARRNGLQSPLQVSSFNSRAPRGARPD